MRLFVLCVVALSVAAPAFAADDGSSPPKEKMVCKREQTHELGSHMRAPKVCMTQTEWDAINQQTQRDLRRSAQKGLNPTELRGGR